MSWWEIIFPKKCLGCKKPGKYFCEECRKTIRKNDQPDLDGTSLFKYQGIIKTAVKALKYQFLTDMEEELEELMDKGLEDKELKEFIKLKPKVQALPLYWKRHNWRGFNQAEILARIVERKFKLERADYLERVKETKPQAELKRKERLKNVRHIFKVKAGKLPQAILLVDDVWTTGATMREARRVVKKAGVKKGWSLTLAR
jgi:competence protein ComFC